MIHELIGTEPAGIVVSDRYAAYAYIDAGQRQICWAHLIRDFTRMADRGSQAGRIIGARLLGLGYVLFRWSLPMCRIHTRELAGIRGMS